MSEATPGQTTAGRAGRTSNDERKAICGRVYAFLSKITENGRRGFRIRLHSVPRSSSLTDIQISVYISKHAPAHFSHATHALTGRASRISPHLLFIA